ncbi:MAG: hypothetical protein L0H26_02160, partial [Microlunatus sp.]|nr:hypothetical protein [Microlunatus sp.]
MAGSWSAWFAGSGRVRLVWRLVAWVIAAVVGAAVIAGFDTRPAVATPVKAGAASKAVAAASKPAPVASRPDVVSAAFAAPPAALVAPA